MDKIFVKVIMFAYPKCEKIIKEIDELILKKALSSMQDFSPCEEQCYKIVHLMNKKQLLIQLKGRVDKLLEKLTEEQIKLLEYKYFKRKGKEYFAGLDVKSRMFFRKQERLVNRIGVLLERSGVSDEWFIKNYADWKFFSHLITRVKSSNRGIRTAKPKTMHQKLSYS